MGIVKMKALMHFPFFPISVSTHHIPDDGQDEKLRTNLIFATYSVYLFHVSAKDERKLG